MTQHTSQCLCVRTSTRETHQRSTSGMGLQSKREATRTAARRHTGRVCSNTSTTGTSHDGRTNRLHSPPQLGRRHHFPLHLIARSRALLSGRRALSFFNPDPAGSGIAQFRRATDHTRAPFAFAYLAAWHARGDAGLGASTRGASLAPVLGARVLAVFGDAITTDQISPVGEIAGGSDAARYLNKQATGC